MTLKQQADTEIINAVAGYRLAESRRKEMSKASPLYIIYDGQMQSDLGKLTVLQVLFPNSPAWNKTKWTN